ncbi:CPSF-A domain-containing protein [Favolaschia claudopus]|uniref:CPSF-A domain-containing protein n=1 Tax=Favolaschia claudopus TaxID=2862362 RepID=A0AAW0D986_9AGAR
MKIVSTFHRPSSVLCSVKCSLTSSNLEHCVVGKLDGLEIYSVQPEGLKQECRWTVWGNVLSVKAESSRSNLIVMLDHPEPELVFLAYTQTDAGGTLTTTKRLKLFESNHNQRPAEFFNDILVHPDGKIALVSCYTGKLKLVALDKGNYKADCDASIMDFVILSVAFLPSPHECAIAILHYDHARRVRLHARTIVKDGDLYDISYELSTVLHPTPISSNTFPHPDECTPKLIPVPCPGDAVNVDTNDESETFIGGVLLIGGTRILLFEVLSAHGQAKQKNKRRKLEQKKGSGNQQEIDAARQKQRERDTKKRKPKAAVDWPWSEVSAWCAIDGEPFRYLIGDTFGRLSMLSLHDVPTNGLVLIPLGETSPPTTLSYLTNQILFVGSHAGDSQLVKISPTLVASDESPTLSVPSEIRTIPASRLAPPTAKGKGKDEFSEPLRDCVLESKGSYLRVIETVKNVAPIHDAVLVDTDNSGHRQIVTCSGGQNTGSIHVMRKGADFQQSAIISGMPHTTAMFPLRPTFDAEEDTHILISTANETAIFEITGNTLRVTSEPRPGRTLAAGNIKRKVVIPEKKRGAYVFERQSERFEDSALVVQVTSDDVRLLQDEMGFGAFTSVSSYNPDGEVVAADINATQVVFATSTGQLVCLEVSQGNTFTVKSQTSGPYNVSALSCTPPDPNSKEPAPFVVVAYWKSNKIEIFQTAESHFVSVCKRDTSLHAVVRSLLPYDFGTAGDPHPYLLAGFGDGSFASFAWNEQSKRLDDEPNLTSLGKLPVHFTPCRVKGKDVLFAGGSRAMVLTWQRDSIHHSPVILKEMMAAAHLNAKDYPSSLLLADDSALFIGQVGNVDEMHIRSIPLGLDVPQRIVYEPSLRVFGVVCTRREPARVGSMEPSPRSSFRLLDDSAFNHLSQYTCDADEEILCVSTFQPRLEDESSTFFCLGTCILQDDENEPTKGRLLVLSPHQRRTQYASTSVELSLSASVDVDGCVYSVTVMKELIAIGVNSSVMLFRLDMDKETNQCKLHNVSKINVNYFATSLAAYENRLVVGDQIASVSLLEVTDDWKIRTLGRDLSPLSPVCVQALNSKHIIAANDTLNLLSFTLDEGNRKLDRDGFYQQSDYITKFVPGSITSPDTGSKLEPIQLFFASSGRIGIIVDIADQDLGLELTGLQRNMANTLENGIDHTTFRTPQSTARRRVVETAYGFLDGDFLERLLTTSPAQLTKIVEGTNEHEHLKRSGQELQQLLRALQALH